MSVAYILSLDRLIPTDLTYRDIKHLLREPLELFEFIRDFIEDEFGRVENVAFNDCNFTEHGCTLEYFAYTKYGRIPVKIICAKDDSTELFIEI
jgi:hypothetical protein